MSHLCSLCGRERNYLALCALGKDRLTPERLVIIADALDTTPEYLRGETDKKEKPASVSTDGLSLELQELIRLCVGNPDLTTALLALARNPEPIKALLALARQSQNPAAAQGSSD